MTLVNVNRFHCANTNLQTSVQYKQNIPSHHSQSHHQYQNLPHQIAHHDTNQQAHHTNLHHQCNHQRRRSSGFDNSSDISSFTSSCSSTSSPALFADKSRLIRLKRNDNDQVQCKSLGFSIRGGWEHGIGFFVSHVQSGSLAEQRGLCAGDEILQINGFPLERVVHDEVIALIRMSPDDLTLRVRSIGLVPFKDCSDQLSWKTANAILIDAPQSPPFNQQIHSNIIYQESQVMIVCQEQSLGCSVVKGPSSLPGIFVQSVKQGRTASNAGLEVGDEIVKVNNAEVASIGFDGAISMLKSLRSFSLIVRKGVAKHLFLSSESSSTSVCTKRFTTTIVEQQQQQQQQQMQQQMQQQQQQQTLQHSQQQQQHHAQQPKAQQFSNLPGASLTASTGTTSVEILSQQTTTTTSKGSCCCSNRNTGESEILAKATNAMENSLRLLQQVCEKEEKLAIAEQKLSQEQQKLRQQQANLQISVTSTSCSSSNIGALDDHRHLHHHHHHSNMLAHQHSHTHGHSQHTQQLSLPAPPLPPLMPSNVSSSSALSETTGTTAAATTTFESSKSVVGSVNGTFSSVASSMVSKSFLEEIKSLGENGTKRYLRPINGADTLPAQGKNASNAASIAFQANQLVKSKILKRMPFAEDERTQRQHELLMEEFKVAHMKMFGSKAFTKKSQLHQITSSQTRDQEEEKHDDEMIIAKVGENPASSSVNGNNRNEIIDTDQETSTSNRITIKVLSTTSASSRRE